MAHVDTEATRGAWEEVGAALDGLGLKVKLHFEEAFAAGAAERDAVEDVLERLGAAIGKVVTPLREVVRDPAVREDVDHVAERLGAALTESMATARATAKATAKATADRCC